MINNLELIKSLLNFTDEGDFYMLYVFKRKKDQPEGEKDNHQSVRTIKTYCIESIDHLQNDSLLYFQHQTFSGHQLVLWKEQWYISPYFPFLECSWNNWQTNPTFFSSGLQVNQVMKLPCPN